MCAAGGVPCLRLEVCADSFMLHQIRHMVGAAVAIVRGVMPRVSALLCAARVMLLCTLARRRLSLTSVLIWCNGACLSIHMTWSGDAASWADSGLAGVCTCFPAAVFLHAQELLELSLSAPGRVPLPRAPPHSLLLFDNQFSPFPAGWGLETPRVSRFTGDRLQLREGGQQMRQEFRRKVSSLVNLVRLTHGYCTSVLRCGS